MQEVKPTLKLLNRKIRIREDTNLARNPHGFHRHIFRGKLGVLGKRSSRGQRERASGTDGADAVIGLNDVAIAGHQECGLGVSNN